jgi:hypothetical protein
VTVKSAGVVLTALLRVGAHAGFQVGTPPLTILGHSFDASTGVEVGVFVDVAEFVTNVTAVPEGNTGDCELRVVEAYSMAVGANAGATVAVDSHTWGPTPNTQVPIWYTTLYDACAVTKTATAAASVVTASGAVKARTVHVGTTTAESTITYTGIGCLSTGLVNCPASLQTTLKGSTVTTPGTIQNTVATTVPFGTNVKELVPSVGTPVSYIPPPPSSTGIGLSGDKKPGGSHKRIVIGVCVGLVMPILIAIIAGAM